MFHQVEGLVIDERAISAHMKWVLEEFCRAFFEVASVKMRFRPSFFPFTEPPLEVDIQCSRKGGNPLRRGRGLARDFGCGMVHPNVLRNCGLDPDEYQGFAWGMGIDRIAMLKYGMPDLRPFFEADVRWLTHYGFRPLDISPLPPSVAASPACDSRCSPLRRVPPLPPCSRRPVIRRSKVHENPTVMKFTLSWLKDHLDTSAPLDEINDHAHSASGSRSRGVEDKVDGA